MVYTLVVLMLPLHADELHDLRVKKCTILVEEFYNHTGKTNFKPHIEYFITYHEKFEGNKNGTGFGAAWWYSLAYGGANFSMRCYATAPGNCAGPLDVKHYPLVLDPKKNIEHHCKEMFSFYASGVRSRKLCESVFYPAAPRDWGGGRFRKTEKKHRDRITLAYQRGELP